jgi:hypothetical protein
MGNLTRTYSHAAPYIREQILNTAGLKLSAKLKRDQARWSGQLHGLIQALEIMLRSDDTKDSPVGNPEFRGDKRAYAEVERYVGGPKEMAKLGFVSTEDDGPA